MKKFKIWLSLNPRLSLLLPYLFIAFFLIILPIVLIVISAFTYHGPNFDNWQVIKAQSTWVIIWRSIKLGLISAVVALIIALPYAYFVSTSNSKLFQIIGMSLIVSPILIFTIARLYAVRGIFLSVFDEASLNGEWFMVFGMIYLNLPFMIMPLFTVFKNMPKNIIEASQDLGYSKFATLFKVILPYGFKAIISGLSLVFISSATTFIVSDKLIPNGSQFQTVGNLINNYANPGSATELTIGSTIVIIVTITIFLISALIHFLPKIIMKLKGMKYE